MALICSSPDCTQEASSLKCPICLKEDRVVPFCGQDCFKRNYSAHKAEHTLEPFAKYKYTGPLKAAYPLGPRRTVPDHIAKPDYATHAEGRALSEEKTRSKGPRIHNAEEIEGMRAVCRLSREVLDIGAAAIAPGVTTDAIDAIIHQACVDRGAYPSPLGYYKFPKSHCSSVNEVICHGIPDRRPLQDGDIVNLDISVYYKGFHGDLNETYYVGYKAKEDKDTVRLVECARDCLNQAIASVKPGTPFRQFGKIISDHAKTQKCSVVRTYCGHGINQLFHTAPSIPHYANSKVPGMCTAGMIFTIEPMINLGSHHDTTWPDNWTAVTQDGRRSAQFEHTLLVTKDGVEVLTARTENSPGGPFKVGS